MHNIFMAQLEGRECLYGEWEPVFESDGRRFNVKIISYGFKEDVYGEISVELTATRSIVNKKKLDQLMTLINNLFSERKITKDVIPFRGGSTFLGEVKFCVGWAIVSN